MKISTGKSKQIKKQQRTFLNGINVFEKSHLSNADLVSLTFENNRYTQTVFGQFNENLLYIEKRLGLDIRPRGNTVFICGEAITVKYAQCILKHLYKQAKTNQELTVSDAESAIVMTNFLNEQQQIPPTVQPTIKDTQTRLNTYKKTIHVRTKTQNAYLQAMEQSELVFAIGPAGTGKTYLAIAHAMMLLERGIVERIILSRPAVEAGERLGFLPGDLKEKVDPYLRPLYDALYDIMPAEKVEHVLASGIVETAPLAFMRGRTLAHSAIILDEAQNTTPIQMKMFLTRFGEGSRMIVTGDISQIDLPAGQKSGLIEATNILSNLENIAIIHFNEKDIVRHPLVTTIINAYDRAFSKQKDK
ncbi:PhoH family protein [Bartonella ancashensis]|uniref:PhoH-like protein n=1 Tax=Bartonella ancashensis TaxID=1318743 RepID=A0A0M3T2V7_9HYPH|nr:PhoH family protein [Bartonella ancashensis]ALE03405.1 Phosphate starvation-inducible ATPase PhoH with RNA binding motif [Bartonella ancashensis]